MNIRKIARDFAQRFVPECELMLEGMPVLIGSDQSRTRYEPRHTVDHPFCDDRRCPCHFGELFEAQIEQPYKAGLMTPWEANNLHWFENI